MAITVLVVQSMGNDFRDPHILDLILGLSNSAFHRNRSCPKIVSAEIREISQVILMPIIVFSPFSPFPNTVARPIPSISWELIPSFVWLPHCWKSAWILKWYIFIWFYICLCLYIYIKHIYILFYMFLGYIHIYVALISFYCLIENRYIYIYNIT